MALVQNHDARIDRFQALTIDKAQFEGHFYLDKAPGMTLLAMPAVAIADALDPMLERVPTSVYDTAFERYMMIRLRLAVALVSAFLTALAALAMFDLGERITGNLGGALFASLAFALGTPIWGWSTTAFGHAPVAALFVIAVWAFWCAATAHTIRFAAFGGAALGLAVLVEFHAAIAGSVIALWGAGRLWKTEPKSLLAAASAGAATLLVPFVAYNMVAFGTPFRLGYSGVVGFDGMNRGLFGLTFPEPLVLEEILVGMRRGLLWVAPILFLAPIGLWQLGRTCRGLAITLALAAIFVLLVNSAYVYWDGGHSTGPRHSIPAMGMLAIALAPFWAQLRTASERVMSATLLGLSIVLNLAIVAANITAPDSYRFPLADPILTQWQTGALRTLPSDLWGWSPYAGIALYLVLAVPLFGLLLASVRQSPTLGPQA